MITAQELRERLDYDPVSGVFRWKTSASNRIRVGSTAGCINTIGYCQIYIGSKPYLAHRLAWLHVFGAWPDGVIDHINGNRSDNRICNLREATRAQNNANARVRSDNTSGLKGVSPLHGRWAAQAGGVYLGLFDTPEEAHAAYVAAAKERFGNFARLT